MGYLSHRVDRDQIKRGDHIYTWRTGFTYSHHGIYVGENKVVHFTAPEIATSGSGWNLFSAFPSSSLIAKSGPTCDFGSDLNACKCGFQPTKSRVMVSCLSCFIGSGSLYLYQYGVKTIVHASQLRGGTCTIATSDPLEDVVYRAIYLLENGFGDYNVVRNNCEDFALYCKTGLLISGKPTTGTSGQVNYLFNAPWKSIVTSALPKLVCSSPSAVTVAVAVGTHCWNRYTTDIGVRNDVVTVNVEEVESFRGVKKNVD